MTLMIVAIVITVAVFIVAGLALQEWIASFGLAVVVGAVLLSPAYLWDKAHYNERTVSCSVSSKDRAENGMRVYTDCGVFENGDSWFRGKTDSADIWGRIEPGHRYTFRVVGWRFSPTSDFPNILEVN